MTARDASSRSLTPKTPRYVGWVGVNIGERDKGYPYAVTHDDRCFTKDGVTIANGGRSNTVDAAVQQCCRNILREMGRRELDAETAYSELHNWMQSQQT